MDTLIRRRLMMQPQGEQPLPPLPDAYQRVEWISNTGAVNSAYIDTLIDYFTDVELKFQLNASTAWRTIMSGSVTARVGANPTVWLPVRTDTANFTDCTREVIYGAKDTNVHIVDSFNDTWDGQSVSAIHLQQNVFLLTNICIFKGISNYGNPVDCKVFYVRFKDKFFVPCKRKSDGVIGMYELYGSISPTTNTPFYINAGTGNFTAGDPVTE